MTECFQGWKRKCGVVTLMMACLFTLIWARSLVVTDILTFPTGRVAAITVSTTGDNRISVRSGYDHEEVYELNWETRPSYQSLASTSLMAGAPSEYCEPDSLHRYKYPIDPNSFEPVDWHLRQLGFGFGATPLIAREIFRLHYVIIPYWSIAIPLTLVSGYLLLSRPCRSNPKNVSKPTSNDET